MKKLLFIISLSLFAVRGYAQGAPSGWTADNSNGTFTNPIFFEDTPDPSMIRVGSDYYLVCSSMHVMPGLPIMHSCDLVNWELIGYVFDRFNPGKEYEFEKTVHGSDAYGKGIWAPSFVYHKGVYYVFANINNHGTQVYSATDPRGPWTHHEMKRGFHDLSVFFDDDDTGYICWGHKNVEMAILNDDLTDIVPGTTRVVTHEGGEGSHMYKINGKYYIIWSVPGADTPMLAGVADEPFGPYRVDTICDKNHLGVHAIPGLRENHRQNGRFSFWGDDGNGFGTLHQGGIIDTPDGEWWGYSMQDHTSLGRETCLSPVTWVNDIPYFGLPGNLKQTPKVWVKPSLPKQKKTQLMKRSDDFGSKTLGLQWQFNHVPVESAWSLEKNPGKLRIDALRADSLWNARNTLTQHLVGEECEARVELNLEGMQNGDVAGLCLLLYPYAWIGVEKMDGAACLKMVYQATYPSRAAVDSVFLSDCRSVVLAADNDVFRGKARMKYSVDGGKRFTYIGSDVSLHFDMTTFQGARLGLFCYSKEKSKGGYALFDNFVLDEKKPRGIHTNIPYGRSVELVNTATERALTFTDVDGKRFSEWRVVKMPLGRIALKTSDGRLLTVNSADGVVSLAKKSKPNESETFQWMELEGGDVVLMSLSTNRYLTVDGGLRSVDDPSATCVSPLPNPQKDKARFNFVTH